MIGESLSKDLTDLLVCKVFVAMLFGQYVSD